MKKYLEDTKQRWENARAVVQQLKNGGWNFEYCEEYDDIFAATREPMRLWVCNGGWFCDISIGFKNTNAFGLIFRHYVYWFGVFPIRKKLLKEHRNKKKVIDVTK